MNAPRTSGRREATPRVLQFSAASRLPLKRIAIFLSSACIAVAPLAADSTIALDEKFDGELSKDWFWGLGTWSAKDGVLRGFESGTRRHGPVKMRKFPMRDGVVECEFRLVGKATFAGIIFNGSPERGHLVHLVMGTDALRILAHPAKGANVELIKQPGTLTTGEWHRVKIEFSGATMTATVDGTTITAANPCIAEEKRTFGLGGDSGGADGEKAGALEFRKLKISTTP